MIRIGTAGWTVPKAVADQFPPDGTALQRYAGVFNCAEINSTFYRSHRPSTYERWAQSVPDDFVFSVKVPKEATHVRKLGHCQDVLDAFVKETAMLGQKRDVLLVQLPPKLAHDAHVASKFFETLQSLYDGNIALEPRHPSWFTRDVDAWLQTIAVARVAADPAPIPRGGEPIQRATVPGGSTHTTYYRLHGSPRMYYSSYDDTVIAMIAEDLRNASHAPSTQSLRARDAWCIFDNTASGAGAGDALRLRTKVQA